MIHGRKVEFKKSKAAATEPLAELTKEQKAAHDKALEKAKKRVLERVRKENGTVD